MSSINKTEITNSKEDEDKDLEYVKEYIIENVTRINLKQFKLFEVIGIGGFSKVYRVMDKETKKIYAARMSQRRRDQIKDDLNIIKIISQLSHPSIVKFIGYSPLNFKQKVNPVIITEYYRNGTLEKIIDFESKGKEIEGWNMTTKLINIYGIASAMSYLHSLDIIHRNLKPGAVLVDDSLFPKLGSFCVPKKLSDLDSENLSNIGTQAYMSPEIYENNIYSKASDVYAFGITVYEILTGLKAFYKLSAYSIMYKIVMQKERPEFTKPIPKIYRELIENCWDEDPQKRPTFEAILNRLKNEKEFITEDVDVNTYRSYIEFIDNEVEGVEPTGKQRPIVTENQQTIIYRKLQSIIEENRIIAEEEKKQIIESLPKEAQIDINQFDKIDKIGHGGFGCVHQIMHKETKKVYAAKTVMKKEDENTFLRELKILSDLNHPAIQKFVGYSLVDFNKKPKLIIITEYMKNQSLFKLLEEKPECLTNTIKLINIYGIASAIDYLHSLNILHLDIKPNNVLENDFLFPKICDFGLSLKILNNQKIEPNYMGTCLFMSPEKIKDGISSKEVDVYAFGMLLHEMKTINHPFDRYSPSQIVYIIDEIIERIDTTIPNVYLELIKSCLDIDPSKRKPIKEIVEMLRTNDKFLEDGVDRELYQKYIWMIDEELKGRDTTTEIKKSFKPYTIYIGKDEDISFMSTDEVNYDDMEETGTLFEDEFTSTFEFRNKNTGKLFSVTKSQYYSRCKKGELEAKLKSEVEELTKLNHPTIPKFYGFVLQQNKYQRTSNIITENLSNKRLFDVFKEERQGKHSTKWTMTNRQKMIYGIASGLSYLHSHNIYIFQLNPKNVLVDSKYEIKLSEIGNFTQTDKTKTTSSIFDYSLFYLSPKQLLNLRDFNDKSDVYSYSLIVYEIITNNQAFPLMDPSKLISKIITDNYRPTLNDQIPAFYQSLLQRCWSKDPEERPSFDQIIDELENSRELISSEVNNDEYLKYQQFLKQSKE